MMTMALLLILALFAAAIPISYLAERTRTGLGALTLFVVATVGMFLLSTTIPEILNAANNNRYTETYYWVPEIDASFSLFVDGISFSISFVALILIALTSLYSIPYMKDREDINPYYSLLALLSLGLIGIFITSNLLLFYFFWELILIPSYFIIGTWGGGDSYGVAFKFFIITHAGAVLVLLGIGSIFVITGSLDMFQVTAALATMQTGPIGWILIAFTIGFAVKLAVVPAHIWLPDAYSESPATMSALLGGVMTTAGAYGILRISLGVVLPALLSNPFGVQFLHTLALFGILSALFGSLVAVQENDVNRMLAYSSISHMGYVVFGLSLFPNPLAIIATVLHLLNHGATKGLFFLTTGDIVKKAGTRDMNELSGVASCMPVTGTCSAISALSIGGVPPFACFISEFLIFMSAFQVVMVDSFYLIPTFLLLAANVLSLAYALRYVGNVLLGPPDTHQMNERSAIVLGVVVALSVVVVILGIWPSIFTQLIALVNFQT